MIIQSVVQISSLSQPRYEVILQILLENSLYYLKTRKVIFELIIIKTVLKITHISLSKFLLWYYQVEIKIPKELHLLKKDRYILVANHRRAIDPYLILATLPTQTYDKLLPLRTFTANVFFTYWWQRCLFSLSGCFRAQTTEGKLSGVKGGLKLSDRGQSLFIFPEGQRVKSHGEVEPKIGVAYLAQKRNFIIIPVHIQYVKHAFKKKTYVSWGKPFKIKYAMKSNLDTLTKYIFNKVQRLAK